jgi:hypothetical protein
LHLEDVDGPHFDFRPDRRTNTLGSFYLKPPNCGTVMPAEGSTQPTSDGRLRNFSKPL